MAKKSLIHVLVANRDAPVFGKDGKATNAIRVRTSNGEAEVAPRGSATLVLTEEQFTALKALQRRAVQREPGMLRLVDFWTEVDGKRVEHRGD